MRSKWLSRNREVQWQLANKSTEIESKRSVSAENIYIYVFIEKRERSIGRRLGGGRLHLRKHYYRKQQYFFPSRSSATFGSHVASVFLISETSIDLCPQWANNGCMRRLIFAAPWSSWHEQIGFNRAKMKFQMCCCTQHEHHNNKWNDFACCCSCCFKKNTHFGDCHVATERKKKKKIRTTQSHTHDVDENPNLCPHKFWIFFSPKAWGIRREYNVRPIFVAIVVFTSATLLFLIQFLCEN